MEQATSEFRRVLRSTETAKSASRVLREWYARAEQAQAAGKAMAWGMVGVPPELLTVLEIDAVWPENYGTVAASRQMAVHFMEIAEADGYSDSVCSYCRNTLGYVRRRCELGTTPPEAPLGGMPDPSRS